MKNAYFHWMCTLGRVHAACVHVLFMCGCTGRFDDSVIEERRQCSEDLLQFSANIPALYGSQHIQDFFKVTKQTHFQRHKHTARDTINVNVF